MFYSDNVNGKCRYYFEIIVYSFKSTIFITLFIRFRRRNLWESSWSLVSGYQELTAYTSPIFFFIFTFYWYKFFHLRASVGERVPMRSSSYLSFSSFFHFTLTPYWFLTFSLFLSFSYFLSIVAMFFYVFLKNYF